MLQLRQNEQLKLSIQLCPQLDVSLFNTGGILEFQNDVAANNWDWVEFIILGEVKIQGPGSTSGDFSHANAF